MEKEKKERKKRETKYGKSEHLRSNFEFEIEVGNN